jgi:hypothetical protein
LGEGPHDVGPDGRNAGETEGAGPPDEPHKKGLRLVVQRVAEGDGPGLHPAGLLVEGAVAEFPRCFLQVLPFLFRVCLHVDGLGPKGNAEAAAEFLAEGYLPVGLPRPQPVVHVEGVELQPEALAQPVEKEGETYGVRAAREADEDRLAAGQHGVLRNGGGGLFEEVHAQSLTGTPLAWRYSLLSWMVYSR